MVPSGGGGRVAFNYSFNLNMGTVDVGSGSYAGTIAENTKPVIVGDLVVGVPYQNSKYEVAVQANSLAVWYKFDQSTGSSVTDYSGNNRHGSLKGMDNSNWVPGVSGNGLSFDSGAKGSTNTTGQYVDMGAWSTGGAMTISTWIWVNKAHDWQHFFNLNNGENVDSIYFRQSGSNPGGTFNLKDTAGGDEWTDLNGFLEYGKWIHYAWTVNNLSIIHI